MNRSFLISAAYFGICGSLFAGGFLIAQLIKFPPDQIGDLATWLGSIGTILAFSGTIYLATEEARRRKNEEWTIARLALAGISMKLSYLSVGFNKTLEILKNTNQLTKERVLTAGEMLNELETVTPSELLAITCLPNRCAEKIAYVNQAFLLVRKICNDPTDHWPRFIQQNVQTLNMGAVHLESALKDCNSVINSSEFMSS